MSMTPLLQPSSSARPQRWSASSPAADWTTPTCRRPRSEARGREPQTGYATMTPLDRADPTSTHSGGGMGVIEVWSQRGRDRVVDLEGASQMIGSNSESASIAIDDSTVSGLHASLTRVGTTWLVCDLGSRNGTRLNGGPLTKSRQLRDRDEIHIGRTRLVFRDSEEQRRPKTSRLAKPPQVTRTEKNVLVELCRPLLSHNAFHPPASVQEIAEQLHVVKNAVQAHLVNLYDKFEIYGDAGSSRRVTLANQAIERGVVTLADLHERDDAHP